MELLLLLGVYFLIAIAAAFAIGGAVLCSTSLREARDEEGSRRILFLLIAVALAGVVMLSGYVIYRLLPLIR